MKSILKLPDGSAFDSASIASIHWIKARPGDYGHKARVTIDVYKSSYSMLGGPPTPEQRHYIEFETDEEARGVCEELVRGWTGEILKPSLEAV